MMENPNDVIARALVSLLFIGGAILGLVMWWRDWRSDESVAKRIRDKRESSYVVEYLSYGYEHSEARHKASARMRKEAQDAEAVK